MIPKLNPDNYIKLFNIRQSVFLAYFELYERRYLKKEGFANVEMIYIDGQWFFKKNDIARYDLADRQILSVIKLVKKRAKEFGAFDCATSEVWAKGSKGGMELARAVIQAAGEKSNFKFLYPLELPIREKIRTIATRIYGAADVSYSELAEQKIRLYTERGYDRFPICMAKTHLSLSHDPALKGAPKGFTLPVRDIRSSVGAGFLYPLCGTMSTMPGLPSRPVGHLIDINDKGEVLGLS